MFRLAAYLLIGKLLIFLLQRFPKNKLPIISPLFREGKLLADLFDCDLCVGFWVYTGLEFLFNVNVIAEIGYIPILSELITGAVATFVMHLLSAGWDAKYRNYYIE